MCKRLRGIYQDGPPQQLPGVVQPAGLGGQDAKHVQRLMIVRSYREDLSIEALRVGSEAVEMKGNRPLADAVDVIALS